MDDRRVGLDAPLLASTFFCRCRMFFLVKSRLNTVMIVRPASAAVTPIPARAAADKYGEDFPGEDVCVAGAAACEVFQAAVAVAPLRAVVILEALSSVRG